MVFESGPDFGAAAEVTVSMPFALAFFLGPTLLELSRFLHHQHLMRAFLNILLCRFEHPMQFSELLIHAMHMIVRDECPIAVWKRTQNSISSQLIQEREAQPIQSLHISDHLDHMWAQWITFLQLAIHQGSPDVEPFGPSLCLKHDLETLDHIVSLNIFEMLLQIGLPKSQHQTTDLR